MGNRPKARLWCGAALCGAAALSGSAHAGPPANALPSIPLIGGQIIRPYAGPGTQGFQNNAGGGVSGLAPTYSTATAGGVTTGTVTLNATRTILDWTSFQVGANARLDFLFPGATAAAIAGDIVINRLRGPNAIDIAGVVDGLTAGGTQTGGQLWFLAPNGVIFEPGSTVAAGRIVAANVFTTSNANDMDFLTATGDDAALMRNGGALIDLRGAVSASGATLDGLGAIVITGTVITGSAGRVDLESTGTIGADSGVITTGTLTGASVGGATFFNASNSIGALNGFSNTGSGDFRLLTNGPLAVTGPVSTPGTLTLTAFGALDTSMGALTAGTDGTGGIDLNARGGAPLTVGALTDTGGGILLSTDGTGDPITLVGPVIASGLGVEATGVISADAAAISASYLTGSSSGGASFANPANAIGAISNFSNGGTGNINLVDSTPGAALQLGDVINLASGAGSGSISLSQRAGDIVQTVARGQSALLQANGDIAVSVPAGRLSAGYVLAGGNIAISAERFTSQPVSALEAGGALSIVLADPNGVVLSDTAPATSSSSWIGAGSLRSSGVTLTQSDGSGIDIGDATVVGAAQVSGMAASLSGPSAPAPSAPPTLTIQTPGPVMITGHLLPAAGVTPDLIIGASAGDGLTPSVIEIVNDTVAPIAGAANPPAGGSIGAGVLNPDGAYSGVEAFGAVTLSARSDILAGTRAFITANLAPLAPGARPNPLLNVPDAGPANLSGGVLIAAETLAVSAGVAILQQNTSGLQTGGGPGLYSGLWLGGGAGAGALTLLSSSPAAFDLYGIIAGSTGAPVSGTAAAISGLISIPTPPAGDLYRFNGCPIGEPAACEGGPFVLAHVVSSLGLPTPPVFGTGGDGDPPVVGPVAVDLWRRKAATSGELPRLSDPELFGVLTEEVNRTLSDYNLDPGLCYDIHVLADNIYNELLKSDVKGVSGARLDRALRKNDTTLHDVIDQGVSEAAQATAIFCQGLAGNAPPSAAAPDPVIDLARFGAVMARAREALDRVPPKILVAVRHR